MSHAPAGKFCEPLVCPFVPLVYFLSDHSMLWFSSTFMFDESSFIIPENVLFLTQPILQFCSSVIRPVIDESNFVVMFYALCLLSSTKIKATYL